MNINPIKNERGYRRVLKEIDALMDAKPNTSDGDRLDVLVTLAEAWEEGPKTYLGLSVPDFPNLFTITGPGSPSVLTNMIASIEQHSGWIVDCLAGMRDKGLRTIEAEVEAQEDWVTHVAGLAQGGVRVHESCTSWYLGANVPGKVRVYMPYAGGLNVYRDHCEEVTRAGYAGFALA